MEKSITNDELSKTEDTLDRLINKAEKLRSILMETESFVEALDGDGITPIEPKTDLPTIVYNVNLGNLREIMNAPSEAFSKPFLEEISKSFMQIANTEVMSPEKVAERKAQMAQQHIDRQKHKGNSRIISPIHLGNNKPD